MIRFTFTKVTLYVGDDAMCEHEAGPKCPRTNRHYMSDCGQLQDIMVRNAPLPGMTCEHGHTAGQGCEECRF